MPDIPRPPGRGSCTGSVPTSPTPHGPTITHSQTLLSKATLHRGAGYRAPIPGRGVQDPYTRAWDAGPLNRPWGARPIYWGMGCRTPTLGVGCGAPTPGRVVQGPYTGRGVQDPYTKVPACILLITVHTQGFCSLMSTRWDSHSSPHTRCFLSCGPAARVVNCSPRAGGLTTVPWGHS